MFLLTEKPIIMKRLGRSDGPEVGASGLTKASQRDWEHHCQPRLPGG